MFQCNNAAHVRIVLRSMLQAWQTEALVPGDVASSGVPDTAGDNRHRRLPQFHRTRSRRENSFLDVPVAKIFRQGSVYLPSRVDTGSLHSSVDRHKGKLTLSIELEWPRQRLK